MLEKIQNQTRICNKSQLKYLIKLLSTGKKSINDLKLACNSKDYTFSRIFNNIIIFLEWMKIIKIYANQVELLIEENLIINSDNMISNLFFSNLFNIMKNKNMLLEFLNSYNVRYIAVEDMITINNNLISFQFSHLRNLLVDLDFLNYDTIIDNLFRVNNYYKFWFIEEIIPLLDTQNVSRKQSLSKLKEKQKQNDLFGFEAEEFVVSFEKKRLAGHIRFNDIQIISEDWSNAGYDIQSFNDNKSIVINRFIEVKSFEKVPYFYWSKNEVEVARLKQNQYFLYLVDRKKINQKDYKPLIIQNPYINVLKNDDWSKDVVKWFIKLKT